MQTSNMEMEEVRRPCEACSIAVGVVHTVMVSTITPLSSHLYLLGVWQPNSFATIVVRPIFIIPRRGNDPSDTFYQIPKQSPTFYDRGTLYITPPEYNTPGDKFFGAPKVIAGGVVYTVIYGSRQYVRVCVER